MNSTRTVSGTLLLTLCILHSLSSDAAAQLPPARNGHDLFIVIDMTGSMLGAVTLSGGATARKIDVAKAAALGWLDSQPRNNAGTPGVVTPTPTEVSVWKFQGSTYTQLQPFTTNFLIAAGAIGSLTEDPSDRTPLAMTMCDLSLEIQKNSFLDANGDGIFQIDEGDPFTQKHLYFATDGQENNTPGYYPTDPLPHHPCGGPDTDSGTSYPHYTTNSWQWHVRNMLLTGEPDGGASTMLDSGVILDVDYIFNSFIGASFAMTSLAVADPAARVVKKSVRDQLIVHDKSIANAEFALAPAQRLAARVLTIAPAETFTERDLKFFAGVTNDTQGTLDVLSPDPVTGTYDLESLAAPQGRVPGDVDYNGCVNDEDANVLFTVWGQTASSSITAAQADLDENGVVNNADYLLILQNFDSGPNC